MIILIACLIIFFCLAFVARRRFGVLGAALVMGYCLHQMWSSELSLWAQSIVLPSSFVITASTLIELAVILVPSLILFFGGSVYKNKYSRIFGAIGYAAIATVLCIEPLSKSIDLNNIDLFVNNILYYKQYIITFAILAAIVDMLYMYVGSTVKAKMSKH